MYAKSGAAKGENAVKWNHQPVAVILNDGSYYIGWITELRPESLTLSGQKGHGKLKKASLQHLDKVKTSAFAPGNGTNNSLEGGGWADPFGFPPVQEAPPAGGGAGWGGFGGFMGFVNQVWPPIQIGLGIVRAVMPLMGGFKL
jgi:hypothetical protein